MVEKASRWGLTIFAWNCLNLLAIKVSSATNLIDTYILSLSWLGFYVENLFLVDCEELDDLCAVLEEGMKNRSVGSHMMNDHSSRSHTILTVHITSEQQAENENSVFISKQGKINFVGECGVVVFSDIDLSAVKSSPTCHMWRTRVLCGRQ